MKQNPGDDDGEHARCPDGVRRQERGEAVATR
jgi:hypothetical protein